MSRKPKSRIPHLHWQQLASGEWIGHWKPSPRLRALGWTNRKLGSAASEGDVLAAALALNAQVAEGDRGAVSAQAARPVPRRHRFADLVDEYRRSPAFAAVADATRREYEVRLGQLERWATGPGGQSIYADQLDRQMVEDFKAALQAGGASPFKVAALLRVLRMLLNWGKPRIVAVNATDGVPIPTPPSRTAKLAWRDVESLAAAAADPLAARALRLGFWTMQRRDDLRQLNRFQWRQLHGADPRDVPALANAKGELWGFRLQQHKTGRWVDCPLPAWLHAEVEAAFDGGPQAAAGGRPQKSEWLFPCSVDANRPISGDVLRRKVKPVLVAGGFERHQLRDLRRSGMSGVKDMGAEKSDVFAISGHPLDGQTRTIADTYMPPDTRAAIRAIAAACRTIEATRERQERNES